MSAQSLQPPLLTRDRKLFLELSPDEADTWITRVFEHILPHMNLITNILTNDGEAKGPLNLEMVLMIANRAVREIAVEMADILLTSQRQQIMLPALNEYCDELLAEGRDVDAIFVQQGLIGILEGKLPSQNPLLVEICLRSINYQVSLINGDPRVLLRTQ